MKLRDINIGRQLRIGLGVILLFVAILGGNTLIQVERMWQETKGLYEHPFMVRRALGELREDIQVIHWGMRELFLAENDQDFENIVQIIKAHETNGYQQFDILFDRYLGPSSDIDEAYLGFVQYSDSRAETIRLLRSGNIEKAKLHNPENIIDNTHTQAMMAAIQKIDDFAKQKADEFYQDALTHRNNSLLQYAILLGVTMILAGLIAWFLLRGIQEPLADLTRTTTQFQKGHYDTRSQYIAKNEFGVLAVAVNHMAETIQTEIDHQERAARIAGIMLSEVEPDRFYQQMLKALLEHTSSQVGAVYLLNQPKTEYDHYASIGLSSDSRASFSAQKLEGEFGAALATQQIQRINDIPADTRFTFSSVSGEFIPKDILTIPIVEEQTVVALVSLANLRSYTPAAIRLVEDTWQMITASMNGVLAFRKIQLFSEKLELQNRELAEQTKEVLMQANELSEQNIELNMQKKQLGEANRLKSTFLSNMSHELRTPLNSVIALSSVLNRRLRGAIPQEEYGFLEIIERNGKHLLELINDILDLSRIEAGREEIHLNRFTTRDLVTEVMAMLEPLAREKGIALLNHVGTDLPAITSDLSKCRHILQNIVSNAVKFTETGTVEITAILENEEIKISVTDSGIGITAEMIPYIFDEFRQGDESASRKHGGTGLGLTIAKKYTELLGGELLVESTPGKGSTFTLCLPLSVPPLENADPGLIIEPYSPPKEAPSQPEGAPVEGKRILLVEDSQPAVIQMTDILTGQGYQVQSVNNGREALKQIETSLPDAVILDLMMPEVDGFQVLRMIRDKDETALLPVLILTAKHVTAEELAFLKGNNIHQLIQKGDISKKDLLAAVARMVAKQDNTAPVQRGASEKPAILIVDDNPDNRETFMAMLGDTYTIFDAGDGMTGLEQAALVRPDLILLDISMPGMDGFKTLAAIRNEDSIRHIPVIALTARAMKGDRENILSNGFDGYISKPVDTPTLEKIIQDVLKKGMHV